MDPVLYICCFLPLIIILIETYQSQKAVNRKMIRKKRKGKVRTEMSELIRKYIGKECLIYTINSQVTGVIDMVEDGWISVKTKTDSDIINTDYILRIREYPKNKKGKNKSVVLD